MNTRASLIILALVTFVLSSAIAKSQDQSGAQEPKAVIIGVVDKIDSKGRFLTLTQAIALVVGPSSEAKTGAPTGRGRGGGGEHGRGGGGSNSGSPGSPAPGATSTSTRTEYKVVVSPETILREDERRIRWTDLKIGDQIEVTTKKEGSKIDAIEIIRIPKNTVKPS